MEEGKFKALLKKAKDIPDIFTTRPEDNIFIILKMQNKEVSTHSAFITYVLEKNPVFLKLFFEQVLNLSISKDDKLEFQREYQFENGRIDFLFWQNGKPIALEMKVWAGEQFCQLQRYSEFIWSNGGTAVYFLTPDIRESKTSTGCKCEIKYITFKKEITQWLDHILTLNSPYCNDDFKMLIRQYKDLIKILTENYNIDESLLNLISSKEDCELYQKLVAAYELRKIDCLSNFFESLDRHLTAHLEPIHTPEGEDVGNNFFRNNIWVKLCYATPFNDMWLPKGIKLLFIVEASQSTGNLYYGFTPRQFDENGIANNIVDDSCGSDIIAHINKEQLKNVDYRHAKNWPYWHYATTGNSNDGIINVKKFNKPYLQLFNDYFSLNEVAVENLANRIYSFYLAISKSFR